MDAKEVEISVLMSEKQHADSQIASFSELQVKLLAFLFGAASAGLGFVLAKGDKAIEPAQVPMVILLVCVAGCVVMIQAALSYGVALGYIHYKKQVLGPRLQELAAMSAPPRLSADYFRLNPARYPVVLATGALWAFHVLATAGLLLYAAHLASSSSAMFLMLACSWILLAATIAIEVPLALAMKAVLAP